MTLKKILRLLQYIDGAYAPPFRRAFFLPYHLLGSLKLHRG